MTTAAEVRFRVDPRGVPAAKAARRLGITSGVFDAKLEELLARGFPRPDPTTGMYDLVAIDIWMDGQQTRLTPPPAPRNAQDGFHDRARRLRMDGAR